MSTEPNDGPAPDTVVFDIGEVLIDESRVWQLWAELIGVSSLTFGAVLGAAVSQGEPVTSVFEHLVPNLDWPLLENEHERRYGGFAEQDLYPDVRPCLQALTDLGLRVVLAGNQPVRRGPQLEALALPASRVLTSEQLGHSKPDPAFFAAVRAQLANPEPETLLYVGDRADNDVLPAMELGWRTCWLRRGPWGRLQDLPDEVEPDLVLEGLGELPTWLDTGRGDDG